jgi:hypothetical protein
MPAPFNHSSGLAGAYDRSPDNPDWKRVVFREDNLAQAAELNEAQSMVEARSKRTSDLIAKDGDRISGGNIIVDPLTGTVVLEPGTIYVRGDVHPVAGMTMNSVPMEGNVVIGVRLLRTLVTEVEDPTLVGLHPGTEAEGEPGAAREVETIAWAREGDEGAGDLISVYLLKDGVVVDQTPPPQLSGVNAALATYDRDAHGSYIVEGCRVSAMGKVGADQLFSISEGVANIYGFKRSRDAAILHKEEEDWDVETIAAEVHTFADGGGGTAVISVRHPPIATLNSVVITKETTQTITKGTTNSADALPHSSVTQIIEVKQGETTYDVTDDYLLTNDTVDWSPGGVEPSSGSSYTVKYRYLSAVTPDAETYGTVTVSGGVTGTTVIVGYDWKLPRVDLLCLDQYGLPAYVKGISMRVAPQPPIAPFTLLPLATIENNWIGKPKVKNIGVRSYHFTKIHRMYERMVDMLDLLGLERLKNDIDNREPVAKKGVFVDPLINDTYRDAGEAQNAAVFQGSMQLPIDPTFFYPTLAAPALLDFTEEIVVSQPLVTGQIKINPYNSYELLPASLKIEPPVDFWVDQPETAIAESFVTQQITQTVNRTVTGSNPGTNTTTSVREQISVEEDFVGESVQLSPLMRQIEIIFTIEGFAPGEELMTLEFGNVNVKPPGTQTANGSGQISGTFDVPANMPTGRVMVYAEGMGGSWAQALFVSQGYYDLENVQRTTTLTRTITRTITTTQAPRPPAQTNIGNTSGPFVQANGGGGVDPVAQSFRLTEDRFLAGVNLKFAAFGDKTKGILVELVRTEHGFPTGESLAQSFTDIQSATLGAWVEVRFTVPVHLTGGMEYAFIVRTDDDDHALATAAIGGFDPVAQEYVGAQPYSVGMLLSSSTATAWTAHQREDLSFELVAAKFSPTTKTISFGTFNLNTASDLLVRAAVLLPSGDTTLMFEIERAGGAKKLLHPNVNWEMDEFVTETVTLRAKFTGTEKLSPVLYPGIIFVAGEIATSATYVSRAMKMGTAVRLSAFLKLWLPSGSDVTVHFDKADDDWTSASVEETEVIDFGWLEREYRIDPTTAVQGRIKVALTGGPAARPSVQDLRAVSI